jgi:mannose-6-phosphate isomerase-like protein (cupin superfamily)
MKFTLATIALFTTAVLLTAAGASTVTYVGHDKVATSLNKSGTPALVSASDLIVSGSHREADGHVELHEKETDVFYVTAGEATFITGGTIVGDKVTKPGQHTGSDIKGGQSHHLSQGDVIVIPAGTPHWFKTVPKSVSYFVVKVLK